MHWLKASLLVLKGFCAFWVLCCLAYGSSKLWIEVYFQPTVISMFSYSVFCRTYFYSDLGFNFACIFHVWHCEFVTVSLLCFCVCRHGTIWLCATPYPVWKCSLQLKLLQLHPLSADHCSSSSSAEGLAVAATRRRWTWVSVAAKKDT